MVAIRRIPGEHRVEGQAGRNLLVQWSVGLAAVHHHLVLHHDAAVVDRRQYAPGRLERPVGPVGEPAASVKREPGDHLGHLDQVVAEQAGFAHHAGQPGRRVLMPHPAEARRIQMSRIAIGARPVDVEQHQLRLGVLGVPVILRHIEKPLVVEAVVQFGVEHRAVVGEVAAEGGREEKVQRRRESFGESAAHGGHQFVGRREVLGDDQFPRPLGAYHVQQSLALVVGVDIVDLARRRGRPQDVGQLHPPLIGEHSCLLLRGW